MTTAHRKMTEAERDFMKQQSTFFRQSGMVELLIDTVWPWFYVSAFGAIIIVVARQAYFLLFELPRSTLSNTAIFWYLGSTFVLTALVSYLLDRTGRAYAKAMLKALAADLGSGPIDLLEAALPA